MAKHWTEDYRIEARTDGVFELIYVPTDKVLLTTVSVNMETLIGLVNEFDTYGYIRPGWREERVTPRVIANNKER